MTPDRESVIKRLEKVSYYFKSLLTVGWQGDADIYREHRESVNMAIALLKEQQETISSFQGTICKLNAALEEQAEIVRCGECKYYREGFCYNPNTYETTGGNTVPDWYCADGKRKEAQE